MGKQGQHQEKELKSCSNWSKVVGHFESAETAENGFFFKCRLPSAFLLKIVAMAIFLSFMMPVSS